MQLVLVLYSSPFNEQNNSNFLCQYFSNGRLFNSLVCVVKHRIKSMLLSLDGWVGCYLLCGQECSVCSHPLSCTKCKPSIRIALLLSLAAEVLIIIKVFCCGSCWCVIDQWAGWKLCYIFKTVAHWSWHVWMTCVTSTNLTCQVFGLTVASVLCWTKLLPLAGSELVLSGWISHL